VPGAPEIHHHFRARDLLEFPAIIACSKAASTLRFAAALQNLADRSIPNPNHRLASSSGPARRNEFCDLCDLCG
jgi:hypothetical protein